MHELMDLLKENPFYEFTAILALATFLGVIGRVLKQPLIVVFIALGVIVGPSAFDIVASKDNIHLLAEIGIAVLLFIVGLKLDLRIIKSVGKIALLTGMGQVIFTSFFGYFISLALGFSSLHSFYIAVALTFSSTIIIVKLLSDKKEIDTLHGQISIGFLIVQDIVVIIVMIVLSAIRQGGESSFSADIFKTLLSGTLLIVFVLISMKWILPKLTRFLAKSQELLTLFAIAWAVLLTAVGEMINFSGEVGAFLAGMSLASSDFKDLISSRLVSLRDFLLLFFFVDLGVNLDLSVVGEQLYPAILLSVFVLIGNPIIVLIIMGMMGYRKRTAFLSGLTVAQISEFSLIFAGLGFAIGHITDSVVGLITLVGLITIGLSTYMILYSHQLYRALAPVLGVFEKKTKRIELESEIETSFDLIIIGLGRFGSNIVKMLNDHPEIKWLGIDFDPSIIDKVNSPNIIYGDIEDVEFIENLPFNNTKVLISTVGVYSLNKTLVSTLRAKGYEGEIYLIANNILDKELLLSCKPNLVLLPHKMAADNFFNTVLKEKFKT